MDFESSSNQQYAFCKRFFLLLKILGKLTGQVDLAK